MAQTTAEGVDGVQRLVGQHLGVSDWTVVTQERLDQFDDATGGRRGNVESPSGGTSAPGTFALSLVPIFLSQIVDFTGFRMGVNYGTETVRFPAPLPVGSRVRGSATLDSAGPVDGGVQMNITLIAEVEGADEPALVATIVARRYV